MKTLILFGAGASYDCLGALGRRLCIVPPLCDSLFSSLEKSFPDSWGKMDKKTKSIFEKDFESGMTEIIEKYRVREKEISKRFTPEDHGLIKKLKDENDKSSDSALRLHREMAIFFSRFRSGEHISKNLYYRILGKINNKSNLFSFATLNYDILFEECCERLGLPRDLALKVHGGCNYAPDADDIDKRFGNRFVGFQGIDAVWNVQPKILDLEEISLFWEKETRFFPMMALVSKTKPFPAYGPFSESLRRTWYKKVGEATRFIIIGVKPFFDDHHIWKPIIGKYVMDRKSELYYIGADNDFSDLCSKLNNYLTIKNERRELTEKNYLGLFSEGYSKLEEILFK